MDSDTTKNDTFLSRLPLRTPPRVLQLSTPRAGEVTIGAIAGRGGGGMSIIIITSSKINPIRSLSGVLG